MKVTMAVTRRMRTSAACQRFLSMTLAMAWAGLPMTPKKSLDEFVHYVPPFFFFPDDLAVLQIKDALGKVGQLLVVGDHDDGVAPAVQSREDGDDLLAGLGIEVAGRLVGQDQRGLVHQGAGDGHPLPLPARKLVRPVRHAVGELHRLQGLAGDLQARRFLDAAVDQGQLDIVQRRGARQQVEDLENEADLLVADVGQLVLGKGADLLAVDEVLALAAGCPGSPAGSSASICPTPTGP